MDTGKISTIEQVIEYFQTKAVYSTKNPLWKPTPSVDVLGRPIELSESVDPNNQPYHILDLTNPGKGFGRMALMVSPGKGYNLAIHRNGGGGTIAKGTGKTLQEAIDNLFIDYGKYIKSYLPRLPEL